MRILFFAESVTLAHLARPLVLSQVAQNAGHEVILACDKRYDWLVKQYPLCSVDLKSIPAAQFAASLAKGAPLYSEQNLESYVENDLCLIKQFAPDLIIGDFRLSLSISARISGIPYATITNAYWSPYSLQEYIVPTLPITRFLPISLSQLLFNAVRPLAFALHTIPLNNVRKRYGLASLGFDLRHIYTDADLVLYADVPDLFSLVNMPTNHVFLGPILWSPPMAIPSWWDGLPKDRPVIYATPGSSGHGSLLTQVVLALADLPVNVIVAKAGNNLPSKFPANFFVADYLPGTSAAARSSLVICNGGSPTCHQALAAGVPVLGIATNLDQYLNMNSIENFGAGVILRADRVVARNIKAAVDYLLGQSSCGDAASRISEKMKEYDSGNRFIQAIVNTVKQ